MVFDVDRDANDEDDDHVEIGVETEIEAEKSFAENPLRGGFCLYFASAINAAAAATFDLLPRANVNLFGLLQINPILKTTHWADK